jgi:hypothetical protein
MDKEVKLCAYCRKKVTAIFQKGKCRECLEVELKKFTPIINAVRSAGGK